MAGEGIFKNFWQWLEKAEAGWVQVLEGLKHLETLFRKKNTQLQNIVSTSLCPWKAPLHGRGSKTPPSLASRHICFWLRVCLLFSFHTQDLSNSFPSFLYHWLKHSVSPSETQTLWFQNIIIMQLYLVTQQGTRNTCGLHNWHNLVCVYSISKHIIWNWVVPRWACRIHGRMLCNSPRLKAAHSFCLL